MDVAIATSEASMPVSAQVSVEGSSSGFVLAVCHQYSD